MLVNPNFTNDDILFESEIDSSLSSSSRRPVENKAITEALKGKSDVNHSHLLKDITDFPTYLEPLFKQNTWYSVGDDSYIGSHGVSGGLGLLGNNGITKLDFCKQDEPEVYKSITFDGTTLNVDGNCEYAKTAGNANTVGGLSPYHVATLDESGNSQGNSLQFYCKFNKFGDNRYGLGINSITDYQIRVDHASTADALSNINSGSSIQPVFFSGGIPVSCSYTIEKSVPSDALFTDTTYTEATTTKAGLLSPTDKAKLDSIIEGANKIEIDSTITNASSNPVQSNAIYEALAGKANTIHSHDDIYYTESEIDDILKNKLDVTLKGASNGLAELDSNGKVPSTQLPSYVDDVIEGYYNDSKFYEDTSFTIEVIGEAGKIYVDISTNKTYRWTGSIFNVISETISLGETSSTAYRGDRGKIAYDHSQADHARTDATKVEGSTTNGNIKIDGLEVNVYTHPEGTNPHGTTKSDVGLSNVDNTADIDKNVLSASKWTTERTISLEGAITGSASIDGSGNVVLTTSEGDLSFKRKTTIITNATDWNTIQDPGAYPVIIGSAWGSSSTYHSPNEYRSDVYKWGILLVFRTGSSSIPAITQIYIPDGGAYQILYRQAYGGTDKWKSWSPMYKGITKQDVGLTNVENKSSETIRSEITSENVVTALGYTPLDSIPYATAKPLVAGTASIGTSTNVAREDHVHPAQISVSGSSGSCVGNSASASKLSPILSGAVGNQNAGKYYYIGKYVSEETEWQGIECTMKFVDSTNKIFDSEIRLIIRHNGTSNNWLRINCFEESLYNLYGRFHIIQISTTEIQIWYQFPPDANDYINPRLYLICGNITNLQLTTTPDATYDELPEGTDKVSKPIPYGSVRIENESPLDLFSNSLDSTHFCWNKKCYVWGQSTDPTADRYIDNAPETYSALWYEVETIGNYGSDDLRGYQIAHGCMSHQRKSFIRYNQGGTWSEWKNMVGGTGTDTDADTVDGKHAMDFAHMTDVICGVKRGWATTSTGIIMTYGDRVVVKTTTDLSYIGWTINSEGWFVPIIVSQYKNGVSYTMGDQTCNYDTAGSNSTTFEYKNRTYYACWAAPMSYPSPTVVGGLQLTLTDDDFVTACKTLIDNCECIDANRASYFESPNNKIKLYEDNEGGNLRLTSPDGAHHMEMDLYNNTGFRIYFGDNEGLYFPVSFDFGTKKFNINGDADTVDGLHANGFIKVNSQADYDCNTLYDAGLYLCNGSATNTPNDLKYGSLFVMPYRHPYGNAGPDYCAQIFIPNGDVDAGDRAIWYRTSLQNTYQSWKKTLSSENGVLSDTLIAQSNTAYTTPQVRNVTMSTSAPSGGSNGQIHFQYS